MSVSDFFERRPKARTIFGSVHATVGACGPATPRVSKSQVGFRRGRSFAATRVPDRHLDGRHAPLVLAVFLPYRAESRRWKEVVEAGPGRSTHRLELAKPHEVDAEVRRLLRLAWESAA